MSIYKKKLNIFKIPIDGINLIEASAGTGKTFTVVLLYLRALLGIGANTNSAKKFLIHEILVVTFTNSAKEELYIRIKKNIKNLYEKCIKKSKKQDHLDFFLKQINNLEEAIYILKKAQENIQNIAIYTIHEFCQKILKSCCFYLDKNFDEKIVENEENLYLQATQDFWRRFFYELPKELIELIYQEYKNPEDLLKKIKPILGMKLTNFEKKHFTNKKLIEYHEKNIKKIKNFKKIWLMNHEDILKKIHSLKINKKIYNTSNLNRWINQITKWSMEKTKDYSIPISLRYFRKKNIENNIIKNSFFSKNVFFEEIENVLKNKYSLKKIIILCAAINIPKILYRAKKNSHLGFDDLLTILLKNLTQQIFLRNFISKKYPLAFIDEFQDTDVKQYKIFNLIYKKKENIALFLIGDPKQSIYQFRGADIFSYLHAKRKIKKHYYLDTNWRSSNNMCKSVNHLFSKNKNSFILKNILFNPVYSAKKNKTLDFQIKGVSQAALSFFFKKEETNMEEYKIWIAKKCTEEIYHWLSCSQIGEAVLIREKKIKILNPSDIAILVRNKKEASIIQKELKKVNINSFYFSNQNSVFHTFDAKELLLILQSILDPTDTKRLKQSITTNIFSKIFYKIEKESEKKYLFSIIEKLYKYYNIWKIVNIFQMINKIILDYQKNQNSIEKQKNFQQNLNFLHLAEILQKKSEFFHKKKFLINWFKMKIQEKKQSSYDEQIRSFYNLQSVKIVTIHKSKGLEYPIVWIPFGIDFQKSRLPFYRNEKNFQVVFETKTSNQDFIFSEKERLAEDMRFLYVAITRAIFHCSIGIAYINKKNVNQDNVQLSALDYIVKNKKNIKYKDFYKNLNKLTIKNVIEIKNTKKNDDFRYLIKKNIFYSIPNNNFLNKKIYKNWKITSFTKIKKEHKLLTQKDNIFFLNNFLKKNKSKNISLTIHNFPKGKNTGIFIHDILKKIDFQNGVNVSLFNKTLNKYKISQKWIITVKNWIKNILNTPMIKNENIILSKLKKTSYIKEMEFFLPIQNTLYQEKFNEIVQKHNITSFCYPKLFFNPVSGILNGFIDLVFVWKKKYYIIDYKSNWIGKDNSCYSDDNIKKEIFKKRYDLQYQIYVIAINKYLKTKIKNYNYKKHFGGVFYFFLRAATNEKNNGVFYHLPDHSLIKKLSFLF